MLEFLRAIFVVTLVVAIWRLLTDDFKYRLFEFFGAAQIGEMLYPHAAGELYGFDDFSEDDDFENEIDTQAEIESLQACYANYTKEEALLTRMGEKVAAANAKGKALVIESRLRMGGGPVPKEIENLHGEYAYWAQQEGLLESLGESYAAGQARAKRLVIESQLRMLGA